MVTLCPQFGSTPSSNSTRQGNWMILDGSRRRHHLLSGGSSHRTQTVPISSAHCRRREHITQRFSFSSDALTYARRNEIAQLVAKHRIPAIFPWRDFVAAGGLISYGPHEAYGDEMVRQAANYVSPILSVRSQPKCRRRHPQSS